MHDQRAGKRTVFRFEDAADGVFVERICAEPINRLGGNANQPAGTKQFGRASDGVH
jgi:hypothetical protein